ncbi:cytochrome c oxidase assembly protein [Sagittula salina]|uniref:Cytochrome c oxidase assembly protein n=1 Tax=Sagittula salina TaxID=2820268 RepID=A0A940MSS2_9RHOB|nr:cytochrome c oxidase assembly protein [Sagittula salina]MBP0483998.1 cytochrome c oxidase assembly protein [Sagittula salina]
MLMQRLSGLALLAALWLTLPGLAAGSMVLHMVLHLGVTAVGPALLAPAMPVRVGPMGLALAAMAEMVVVWGWHLPSLHLWARMTSAGFLFEQASFLAVGLLLWAMVRGAGAFGGAVVLMGTVMHMTLLGALIGLAPRSLWGDICAGHLGLTALQEQQVAGVLMAGGGGALYLAAALARLGRAVRDGQEDWA